jgi:opacity protein-like surface antigen
MKRLIAALALAVLAVPAFAADIEQNDVRTELQAGYHDPA